MTMKKKRREGLQQKEDPREGMEIIFDPARSHGADGKPSASTWSEDSTGKLSRILVVAPGMSVEVARRTGDGKLSTAEAEFLRSLDMKPASGISCIDWARTRNNPKLETRAPQQQGELSDSSRNGRISR